MKRLFGRLSVHVGLSVVLALCCALVLQLFLGRLLVEHVTGPLRDRSLDNALKLLTLSFRAGALDGANLGVQFGAQEDLVVAVYDSRGRLDARSRSEPVTVQLSPELMRQARRQRGKFVYLTEPRVGEEMAALVSVERRGEPYYLAVVDRYTPARLSQARAYTVALALGTMALFGLGFGFVLARRIRRSMLDMQALVRRLARGDRSASLPAGDDDELGALVSELGRMASELAEAVARLEAAEGQRRRMFADLSHELYTPLTNVLGYLESLSMGDIDRDPSLRRRYLHVALQQSEALAALVEDLRTLSRLECEGLPLVWVPLAVHEVLEPELLAFDRRARQQGQSLECVTEGRSLWVHGDGARLAQVLRNLLDNALRHSPRGETVRVSIARHAQQVVLSVSDRGPGIAPEHLAHLTERFYRADVSRSRSTGGRGLGLAIARAIVEAHGGTLSLESRVGEGTTVRVALPALDRATYTNRSHPELSLSR